MAHFGPPTKVGTVKVRFELTKGPSSVAPSSPTVAKVGPATVGVPTRTIFEGGDMYFEQDFLTPSSQWHAVHGLGKIPGVLVLDSLGNEIGADVQVDAASVTVTWPGPTTGKVVCS